MIPFQTENIDIILDARTRASSNPPTGRTRAVRAL